MARIWSLPLLAQLAGRVRHCAWPLIYAVLLSCVVGAACSNASVPAVADEPTSSHGYDESASAYDATPAASETEEPVDSRRVRRHDGTSNFARARSPSQRPVLATKGADDVADNAVVVRGGTSEVPKPGEVFSGAAGRTLDEAASGVPHGQVRATTARDIRAAGGTVTHAPEPTRSGLMNPLHVDVCLGSGPCPFGSLQPNPVPTAGRYR